ncbi:organic solvent tolerance protein [Pseudomonas aeruginosa]|nr:organic solvent tolerance protein [Pseudomonas aeruginosa]
MTCRWAVLLTSTSRSPNLSWRYFTARLNAQSYQLATTTDITPYDRLPQITFNGFLPYNPGGLKLDYSTEFVRFDRDLDENVYFNDDGSIRGQRPDAYLEGLARATGDRMHLEPGVSLPMTVVGVPDADAEVSLHQI